MHLDVGQTASLVSVILGVGAAIAAILSARSSKKSKAERDAATLQQQREAERLEAEEERISVHEIGRAHV